MRAFSPSEKLGSALRSKPLSPASKHRSSWSVKPGSTQGWRARTPCRETSAGNNAPWLDNSAFLTVGKPACSMGSRASPTVLKLGTKPVISRGSEKQSSYFSASIAILEKIISLGPTGPSYRSTDHERHHAEQGTCASLLAGYL